MRRLVAASLLFLSSHLAQAATFIVEPGEPTALNMLGDLVHGDAGRFGEALREADARGQPIKTLILVSDGGFVGTAGNIADGVQQHQLATRTAPNRDCASACVLILAAGQSVTIASGSRVGVHQARLGDGQATWDITYRMAAYLSAHGLDHAAVVRMLDKSGTTVDWLTADEMRRSGWKVSTRAQTQEASVAPIAPPVAISAKTIEPRQATAAEARLIDLNDTAALLRRLRLALQLHNF